MKLIDKDALVAEIEKLTTPECGYTLNKLLDYIDTLEVKEVQEAPVSEELERAANFYANTHTEWFDADNNPHVSPAFKAGAKWQKEHLWKPANGDDLPEIDKGVIVLTQSYPLDGTEYVVSFAHRPYKEKYIYKNLTTGNIDTFENETYDEGGWNIPNIKYWLDCLMPKEIEL